MTKGGSAGGTEQHARAREDAAGEADRLRALWRRYWLGEASRRKAKEAADRAHMEALIAWRDAEDSSWANRPPEPRHPPSQAFPDELRGLTCGARTRAGTPCKRIDINRGGRCKLHGGMSTGPTTPEGKAAASRNAKRTP